MSEDVRRKPEIDAIVAKDVGAARSRLDRVTALEQMAIRNAGAQSEVISQAVHCHAAAFHIIERGKTSAHQNHLRPHQFRAGAESQAQAHGQCDLEGEASQPVLSLEVKWKRCGTAIPARQLPRNC